MKSVDFCYVASKPGQPGAYAACADMPEYPKDTANFVSGEIRRGATVQRVPSEQARTMLGEWLKWDQVHGKRAKKRRAPVDTSERSWLSSTRKKRLRGSEF